MTCYEPMIVDYAPVSAGILVQQSEVLNEIADESAIDPETLAKAQVALEHDMAFYALTDEEVTSLYERLVAEWQSQGQAAPAFENVNLEITPDAEAAAQFIISLLTSK
jgi:formate dehydrogenase maturation protein FdhE